MVVVRQLLIGGLVLAGLPWANPSGQPKSCAGISAGPGQVNTAQEVAGGLGQFRPDILIVHKEELFPQPQALMVEFQIEPLAQTANDWSGMEADIEVRLFDVVASEFRWVELTGIFIGTDVRAQGRWISVMQLPGEDKSGLTPNQGDRPWIPRFAQASAAEVRLTRCSNPVDDLLFGWSRFPGEQIISDCGSCIYRNQADSRQLSDSFYLENGASTVVGTLRDGLVGATFGSPRQRNAESVDPVNDAESYLRASIAPGADAANLLFGEPVDFETFVVVKRELSGSLPAALGISAEGRPDDSSGIGSCPFVHGHGDFRRS